MAQLRPSNHVDYLRGYLADLNAVSVIEEPAYFDRDYLAEHSAFYCTSARGYANVCRRLHFFKDRIVNRERLRKAIAGVGTHRDQLQSEYLGLVVLRPIDVSPLGRTVLGWYPDLQPATPRVTSPSREYTCHIAGMPLRVVGLGWQQQDQAVSACATIALWTMLHSSGFDDHHAIPTTAAITRRANEVGLPTLGRTFPSRGLTIHQICQAIRASHLEPVVATGDVPRGANDCGFSRGRFAAVVASLVRSRYPVLIGGDLGGRARHAVCLVGFREAAAAAPSANTIELQDAGIQHVYVHDDNLGPNVRFRVATAKSGAVQLALDPPPPPRHSTRAHPTVITYPPLTPTYLVAAVHEDLRTSADAIHDAACQHARLALGVLIASGAKGLGLTISTRFANVAKYMERDLPAAATSDRAAARARLMLLERAEPMSLHLGVARVGMGSSRLFDILFDTTDSDVNLRVFGTVSFHPKLTQVLHVLRQLKRGDFGEIVEAH